MTEQAELARIRRTVSANIRLQALFLLSVADDPNFKFLQAVALKIEQTAFALLYARSDARRARKRRGTARKRGRP